MGVDDFALTCGSEPVMNAVCTAVVGSARSGRLRDAGSDREGTSSDMCCVGDTQKSFSENDDDSIPAHSSSAESCHIATYIKTVKRGGNVVRRRRRGGETNIEPFLVVRELNQKMKLDRNKSK